MAHIPGVSPTELIRSSWGNAVASELNARCVKVNGEIGEGPSAVPAVNQWMTGTLIINASPSLKLRRTGDAPFVQFETTTGATILAQLQASSTAMIYDAKPTAAIHSFRINAVEKLKIDTTGAVATNLTVTTKGTFGAGGGEQIRLVDTSTSGSDFHDVYMAFYGAGVSLVSPGARTGYVGFPGTNELRLFNEVLDGDTRIGVTGAGTVYLASTTGGVALQSTTGTITLATSGTGNIDFTTDGAFKGRMTDTNLLWGKSAAGVNNVGVELWGIGAASGLQGSIRSTIGATGTGAGTQNLVLNRVGPGAADNHIFLDFEISGASRASVTVRPTAGVDLNNVVTHAPSDYRWKDDLGPVVGALGRVLQLRPRHVRWRGSGVEADEFMAHEVADVFPNLVKGVKDAVTASGAVDGQSMNTVGMMPDVVAAIQEIAAHIGLTRLEGAA